MKTLQELRNDADRAGNRFDQVCKPHYCDGRWGAYRAYECNQAVPREVEQAMDEYHAATQNFYLARDGEGGFLGGR